jgi:hypothetical protein
MTVKTNSIVKKTIKYQVENININIKRNNDANYKSMLAKNDQEAINKTELQKFNEKVKENTMDLSYETKKLLERINTLPFSLNDDDYGENISPEKDTKLNSKKSENPLIHSTTSTTTNRIIKLNMQNLDEFDLMQNQTEKSNYKQTNKLLNKIKEIEKSDINQVKFNKFVKSSDFTNSKLNKINKFESSGNIRMNSTMNSNKVKVAENTIYRTKSTVDTTKPTNLKPFKFSTTKNERSLTTVTSDVSSLQPIPVARRIRNVTNDDLSKRYSLHPRFFETKQPDPARLNETTQSFVRNKSFQSSRNNYTYDFGTIEPGTTKTSRLRLISNKKYLDNNNNVIGNSASSNNNIVRAQSSAKINISARDLVTKRNSSYIQNRLSEMNVLDPLINEQQSKANQYYSDKELSMISSIHSSDKIDYKNRAINEINDKDIVIKNSDFKVDEEGEGVITLNFDLPNDVDPSNVNVLLDEKSENIIIESSDKKDNYYIISLPKNSFFDDLQYSIEKVDIAELIKEPSLNLELSMNIELERDIDPSKISVTLNNDNIIVESKESNNVLYAVSLPENTDFDRMEYSLEKISSNDSYAKDVSARNSSIKQPTRIPKMIGSSSFSENVLNKPLTPHQQVMQRFKKIV